MRNEAYDYSIIRKHLKPGRAISVIAAVFENPSALHFRRHVFIWKSIGTFRFKCSSPLQRWRSANEIKFQSW